jgi:beta-lactam-binding protein with PASTA domain
MRTLTVLSSAAVGVAATLSVGAGVAVAAPDVLGQTYRDAKNTIQSQGSAVVIATRTGGSADIDKCIVTNAWGKPSVDQPRQASGPNEVWLALSCNAAVAGPGTPGNSAASPAGRQAITARDVG